MAGLPRRHRPVCGPLNGAFGRCLLLCSRRACPGVCFSGAAQHLAGFGINGVDMLLPLHKEVDQVKHTRSDALHLDISEHRILHPTQGLVLCLLKGEDAFCRAHRPHHIHHQPSVLGVIEAAVQAAGLPLGEHHQKAVQPLQLAGENAIDASVRVFLNDHTLDVNGRQSHPVRPLLGIGHQGALQKGGILPGDQHLITVLPEFVNEAERQHMPPVLHALGQGGAGHNKRCCPPTPADIISPGPGTPHDQKRCQYQQQSALHALLPSLFPRSPGKSTVKQLPLSGALSRWIFAP